MKFTSNQGRELLRRSANTPNVVEKKWARVLPTNYKLRWNNIWETERVRKEAGLMWMIWHKAVAVNVWRRVVSPEIDQNCPVCLRGIREIIMYRFWECPVAQRAWKWGEAIINFMASARERRGNQIAARTVRAHTTNSVGPQQRNNCNAGETQGLRIQKISINWKQSIFGHRLPNRFKILSRVWLFIQGVVLWDIWEQRNEAAFDGRHWHPAKLYHKLWLSIIDYSRISWSRLQSDVCKVVNNQEKREKLIKNFRDS